MFELGRTAASDLEEVNDILAKFAEALNDLSTQVNDLATNQSVIPDGCEVQPTGWANRIESQLDPLVEAAAPNSQSSIRQTQIDQLLWWAWAQGIVTGIPASKLPFPVTPDLVASKG